MDGRQRRVRPAGHLPVDRDTVDADGGQLRHKLLRDFHHQVYVQRFGRHPAQRAGHQRAKGDGGHKMPVHHVDVEHIDARGLGRADILTKAGKVRRQDRGAEFKHGSPPTD